MKIAPQKLQRTFASKAAAMMMTALGLGALCAPPAHATVLFSQNFQTEVDASRTTLTASDWNNGTNGWNDTYNTTTFGVATATTSGANNFNSLSGPAHTTAGMSFSTPGASYDINFSVATVASNGFGNSDRFVAGVSLTQSDPNGIYAFINNGTLSIGTGNPVGGNWASFSSVSLATTSANTFYTVTLNLTSIAATATVYDQSNTVLGTTSYTLPSALTGTPYNAVRIGSRDVATTSLVYFASVSAETAAIPEPSTFAMLIGSTALALAAIRRRRE